MNDLPPDPASPPPRPPASATWPGRWSLETLGTGLSWAVPVGAVLLGGWMLIATWQQQSWVSRSFAVRFRTSDASGIWPGVNVTVSGYRVGRVEEVTLAMDGKVDVDLRIAERYRRLIGPDSRAERYQEGLIGTSQIALSADVTPSGQDAQRTDLLIPFRSGPDLAKLLEEIGTTRLKLNRTLEGSAKMAERDLPRAIASFRSTMEDLRRLSARLELETGRTASTTRQTLQVYEGTAQRLDTTGTAARKATEEALALMKDAHPPLVATLREVRELAQRTNALLQSLGVGKEAGLPAVTSTDVPPAGPGDPQTEPPGNGASAPP